MLFFSFIFKEWVGVLLGIVFIFVCLIFFNFVRKVKYPNERFSIMIITLLSVLSTITIGYYFLNYETVYSNLYYLNYLYNRGEVASDIYFEVLKFTKINLYFTIFISIGMLIFGVVSSKRRLSSILTPMIVCIGLLLSVFIYNYALDSKFLVDTFANKKWMFYLITVGSLLSLAIFDLIFIKVAKICGGKPSELRSKGE